MAKFLASEFGKALAIGMFFTFGVQTAVEITKTENIPTKLFYTALATVHFANAYIWAKMDSDG